jgi:DnaJ-class molecular chaperone
MTRFVQTDCKYCVGSGKVSRSDQPSGTCDVCLGTGRISLPHNATTCQTCAGSGRSLIDQRKCPTCRGFGYYITMKATAIPQSRR